MRTVVPATAQLAWWVSAAAGRGRGLGRGLGRGRGLGLGLGPAVWVRQRLSAVGGGSREPVRL
jgi:hypothetical protein